MRTSNFVGRVCVCVRRKHHFACPGEKEEERNEEDEGRGCVSCYPGNAARWEKGHRMAMSSGSSVSEDVWTLIKMCRASGRVPLLSSILSLSSRNPLPPLPFVRVSSPRSDSLVRACACVCRIARTHGVGAVTFGVTGNVTWTASADRLVIVAVFYARRISIRETYRF